MKHLIYILCGMMTMTTAFADTDICRKRNTAVILLSKSTDGTSMTSDASARTWSVTFDYTTLSVLNNTSQTISGIAACNEISGTANTANTALFTTTSDEGSNCWCEMWAPAHSYWTFTQTYQSDAACASGCAADCANMVKTSTAFRTGMFSAIW